MIWSQDPQKELQNIFKMIETGRVKEANLDSLVQLLDKQPSLVPEAIMMLNRLSQNGDVKVCSSVISTLNWVAEKGLRIPADSINVIVCCMQTERQSFHEDLMLDALEILLKIYQEYPERMSIVVPELLVCLENNSPKIRNKAYLILDSLVATRTEFFLGRSKELIRVLNCLSLDARIYGCRLILNISVKNPTFVMDTYSVVEDLRLNHPDSRLRSEAGYAIEKLKAKEQPAEKKSDVFEVEIAKPVKDNASGMDLLAHENPLYECTNLIIPDDADLKTMLETMGLKHLIKKI